MKISTSILESDEPQKPKPIFPAPVQSELQHPSPKEVIDACAANVPGPTWAAPPEGLEAFILEPNAFECWREELEAKIREHLEDEEEQRFLLESSKTVWAEALKVAAEIAEREDVEGASHQAQKEADFLWGKFKQLNPSSAEYASVQGQLASKLVQVVALRALAAAKK